MHDGNKVQVGEFDGPPPLFLAGVQSVKGNPFPVAKGTKDGDGLPHKY